MQRPGDTGSDPSGQYVPFQLAIAARLDFFVAARSDVGASTDPGATAAGQRARDRSDAGRPSAARVTSFVAFPGSAAACRRPDTAAFCVAQSCADPARPGAFHLVAGQLAVGIVYRTASDGPHWEFGGAFQPSFNSRNQPTDPRYTLQLQGSVAYADPWSAGRFHTSLFAQVVGLQNLAPASTIVGLQLGGQLSVDIIADRWSLFTQAAVAGQWTLHDSGGPPGLLQFGPQFTVLGTTI